MSAITVGLDIAKSIFQIHGVDRSGTVVFQRKLRRSDVLRFFSKLQPCSIGIDAATHQAEAGNPVHHIQHNLRHSSIAATSIYLHAEDDARHASTTKARDEASPSHGKGA